MAGGSRQVLQLPWCGGDDYERPEDDELGGEVWTLTGLRLGNTPV